MITERWTVVGCFLTFYLYMWVAVLIVVSAAKVRAMIWLAVAVLLWSATLMMVHISIKKRQLKVRDAQLLAYAQAHNYPISVEGVLPMPLGSAIEQLHNEHLTNRRNVVQGDGWNYCDFSYVEYGHLKNTDYQRTIVYYGVLALPLPRQLPNVFFDSLAARGRQFRFQFLKDQRHQLEGDFNNYFATYFPEGYTIDSMSFIGPDVMWALREAHEYDVEIFDNHLFLYGPLYQPDFQLEDMASKGKAIVKALAVSAAAYRDDRLPYVQGQTRVTASGLALRPSKFWQRLSTATAILFVLLYFLSEFIR